MCEAFEWNHLPQPGGIYGQNPKFLERVYHIMIERQKEEKRKADKDKNSTMGGASRTKGRIHR